MHCLVLKKIMCVSRKLYNKINFPFYITNFSTFNNIVSCFDFKDCSYIRISISRIFKFHSLLLLLTMISLVKKAYPPNFYNLYIYSRH